MNLCKQIGSPLTRQWKIAIRDDSSANPHRSVLAESNVPKTPALVEAQGWIYGQNGEVILTTQSPTVTPHNPLLTPAASCNAN